MSNKKTKTTKKTMTKKAPGNSKGKAKKASGAAEKARAPGTERGGTEATASRLPPVGTVIRKLDRHGNLRCQCTITEEGVRYKGLNFRSLSGAAMAAAKDLGLENKTQNGFTFWGLSKPTRKLVDPVGALVKFFGRYHGVAAIVTAGATDQSRARLRSVLQEQGQAIENLLGQVAS